MTIEYIHKSLKIVNIKGKGRGFIAKEFVPKNTIILIENPKSKVDNFIEHPMFECIYQVYKNKEEKEWSKLHPNDIDYDYDNTLLDIPSIKNKKLKDWLLKQDVKQLSIDCAKYKRNAFNMDNEKRLIKPCILYFGAIFNHSCIPNVLFKFIDDKMIFTTNRDIKANEELTDNYVDISLPEEQIQKRLQEQYNFKCNCPRHK